MSRLAALGLILAACDPEPPPSLPAVASSAPAPSASASTPDPEPPRRLLKPRAGCERDAATSYRIDQAIDDLNGTFSGELVLTLFNPSAESISELPVLLHPNVSKELGATDHPAWMRLVSVRGAGGVPLTIRRERPTLAWIKLVGAAAPGAAIELTIRYEGKLRRLGADANDMFSQALGSMGSLTGAAPTDYGLLAIGDGILTAASAFPTVAPYRDGAFDVDPPAALGDLAYNHVASFEVRTVAASELTVVTNLVDAAAAARPGDLSLTVSRGECVRDFVLVAGRDLARSEQRVGETVVTSVYRRRDAERGREALAAGAAALASFERRFGAYPYTELDIVEASLVGGAGGVEFSALVLIAGMLYRPLDASSSPVAGLLQALSPGAGSAFKQLDSMLEFTVAHEVAHQYFAGIVGNDARRHPSLDEPLAQYAAGLAYADRHGKAAAERAMNANVLLNYAAYRMLGGVDRPVLRPTPAYRSALEYAGLVYGKAPYLYVSLSEALGEQVLNEAIRQAVSRYAFQLVTPSQWIAAIEGGAGAGAARVRPAFERWLEQTHGDEDLGVDGSGDRVLGALFSEEMVREIRQGLALIGLTPEELMRGTLDGGVP